MAKTTDVSQYFMGGLFAHIRVVYSKNASVDDGKSENENTVLLSLNTL